MKKKISMLGLCMAAFTGLGLFACNQPDNPAAPGKPGAAAGGTGKARVLLPALPPEFLAKSGPGGAVQAEFALSIYGEGMDPINQSWRLDPGKPQSVYVSGIPAGRVRYFDGRIIRHDSASGDTTLTHQGLDSAFIVADAVTDVSLYLRKVVRGGGAQVCVQVEGWGKDSSCVPPIKPPVIDYSGCWSVSVQKHGLPPVLDSFFVADLRLTQSDSNITAVVTWPGGARDSSSGYLRNDGVVIIGYAGGAFTFKGQADTGGVYLRGWFNAPARGVYGPLSGKLGPCGAPGKPQPLVLMACYKVARHLDGDGFREGGLVLVHHSDHFVHGTFRWNGLLDYNAEAGTVPGFISGTWEAKLRVLGLFGGADQGVEWQYYNNVAPTGPTLGTIFSVYKGSSKPVGNWTAERSQCGDFEGA